MTSIPTLTPTQTTFQTVETTGTIDENGVLTVAPLVGVAPGTVRLFVLVTTLVSDEVPDYDDSEPTAVELAALQSHSFPEWDDPAEDIYTWEDGEPVDHEK